MLEFVGLRAKAYACKQLVLYPKKDSDQNIGDIVEIKRLKGIKKCVVRASINFNHYLECLQQGIQKFASMVTLRSFLHTITTIFQNKVAMSRFDDKRYLLDDGMISLPFGHYSIDDE